jgi:hypothetical protein
MRRHAINGAIAQKRDVFHFVKTVIKLQMQILKNKGKQGSKRRPFIGVGRTPKAKNSRKHAV